jgi:hypothetical protein
MRTHAVLAAVVAGALSLACDFSTDPADEVARIRITPDSFAIRPGDSVPFTASAANANNQPVVVSGFTWSIDHEAIASITRTGETPGLGSAMVRGNATGATKIRAHLRGFSAEAQVVVDPTAPPRQ